MASKIANCAILELNPRIEYFVSSDLVKSEISAASTIGDGA